MFALQPEILVFVSIAVAHIAAVVSPGPSFLLTARTSVAKSRRDGMKVALGLGLGASTWAAAALFGLNALFHALPVLFMVMKIAGAVFLLWIAFQIFRHAKEPLSLGGAVDEGSPFMRGLWVQLSNPKVMVFFGSIFIAMLPANPPPWLMLTLLAMVAINECLWYAIVALFFGAEPVRYFYLKAKTWIDRITGIFLGAIGARLLMASAEN